MFIQCRGVRRVVVKYALQLTFEVIVFQIYICRSTFSINVPSCLWVNWSYTNYEKSVSCYCSPLEVVCFNQSCLSTEKRYAIGYIYASVSFASWGKSYCCNFSAGVALNALFTMNGMCAKNNTMYMWRKQAIIKWSRRVNSIVACCHSAKLCALAARAFGSQHYAVAILAVVEHD